MRMHFSLSRITPKRSGKWHGQDGNAGYLAKLYLEELKTLEHSQKGGLSCCRCFATIDVLLLSMVHISGVVLELAYMHAYGEVCECYFGIKSLCLCSEGIKI